MVKTLNQSRQKVRKSLDPLPIFTERKIRIVQIFENISKILNCRLYKKCGSIPFLGL